METASSTNSVRLLDRVYEQIRSGQVHPSMDLLFKGLREVRRQLPTDDWEQFRQNQCLSHPVKELIHQDPFTFRAFSKPRGYAGDAESLDIIYSNGSKFAGGV